MQRNFMPGGNLPVEDATEALSQDDYKKTKKELSAKGVRFSTSADLK